SGRAGDAARSHLATSRADSRRSFLPRADVGARDRAVDPVEADLARDLDIYRFETRVAKRSRVSVNRDGPSDAARPLIERAFHLVRKLRERDHVGDREATAPPQHAMC